MSRYIAKTMDGVYVTKSDGCSLWEFASDRSAGYVQTLLGHELTTMFSFISFESSS